MYKIAFFTYDWNNEITSQYFRGLERFLHVYQDTTVNVIEGFGRYGSQVADQSVFQIFNVPQISTYDGIIIQGNRVWDLKEKQVIADRAHENHVPVVSINNRLNDCMFVGTDNYSAMKEMVHHVIVEHGAMTLAFVQGPESSEEARDRTRAFVDTCRENGIPKENTRIIPGTWAGQSGTNAVQTILEGGVLPDALICSNDEQAVSAVDALKAAGYRVPDDVIVTGFDNIGIAESNDPRITTIDRSYEEIAYTAMWVLRDAISGKNSAIPRDPGYRPIFSMSCGCGYSRTDLQNLRHRHQQMDYYTKLFYTLRDSMGSRMERAENMQEVLDAFEQDGVNIGCGTSYLVINKDYVDKYENAESVRHYGDRMLLMAISSKRPLEIEHDKYHVYDEFDKRELLPEQYRDGKQMIVVYPLRYEEICIGYIAVTELSPIMQFYFLEIVLEYIENSIEMIRRKNLLRRLNEQLTDLYMTDSLTGLYNRFGLNNYGKRYYDTLQSEGKKIYICFIDIDNMKAINDNFSHDSGDEAIMATGEILEHIGERKVVFSMRYGGDEFVTMSEMSIMDDFRKTSDAYLEEKKFDFDLQFSLGQYIVESPDMPLQEAIDNADDLMYQIKKAKKIQRGVYTPRKGH